MPRILWESIRETLRNAFFPGEKYCLRDTDAALVDLLHEECRSAIGDEHGKIRVPSFRRGYYWSQLVESFRSILPENEATLQTIYILISCNFNSPAFVQYVQTFYGKDLEADMDVTGFWLQHLLYINGIVEKPDMALNPSMDTCRILLMERINNEINAKSYKHRTQQLNESVIVARTSLSIPQLAFFYRLQVETGMLHTKNKRALMKQVAILYQTQDGIHSYKSLYDKFYNVDKPAIEKIKSCLNEMLNLAIKLGK